MKIVSFKMAGVRYGVDIAAVKEIIKLPEITRMPDTPDYIEGVISLRGCIIPILDLRKRFRQPSVIDPATARVIIIELATEDDDDDPQVGVIVDGVEQVSSIADEDIEAPSRRVAGISKEYLMGIGKDTTGLILLIDVNRVLAGEEKDALRELAAG